MKKHILTLVAVTALAFSAQVSAQSLAVVNGKDIPKAELDKIELELKNQGQIVNDEIRAQLKQEIVAKEVFLQEANKLNIAKQDDYIKALEVVKKNLLVQGLFADYLKKNQVTDAEIKADYDKTVAALGTQEYKVSHILVATEAEAKKVIADLKKSSFAQLAKTVSTDKPSAERGGDLGWTVPSNYVPEFGAAFAKLKKGQLSEPVKTQFGWHVIKLEDQRKLVTPALKDVKAQVEQKLQQQKVVEYQHKLMLASKIDIK